ncbi:unnamed protein product [Amoebophrya sp. A120]|nr:unnamed protein product [Amoebophrya sp. A120]|eukprot:GSA120T00006949001.1
MLEGLPIDLPNFSKTTARTGLEWHKWRSLYALHQSNLIASSTRRRTGVVHDKQLQLPSVNIQLEDLLDAFEVSSPPEAGWIAQMIGEYQQQTSAFTTSSGSGSRMTINKSTASNPWSRELLEKCASIVGGLLKDPANTGYDYSILSEAAFACFNVNTLSAELELMEMEMAEELEHLQGEDDGQDLQEDDSNEEYSSGEIEVEDFDHVVDETSPRGRRSPGAGIIGGGSSSLSGSTAKTLSSSDFSSPGAGMNKKPLALRARQVQVSGAVRKRSSSTSRSTRNKMTNKTPVTEQRKHSSERSRPKSTETRGTASRSTKRRPPAPSPLTNYTKNKQLIDYNSFPLLKLLSTILTAGETQVNVTRAAVLPLLGSLNAILRDRIFLANEIADNYPSEDLSPEDEGGEAANLYQQGRLNLMQDLPPGYSQLIAKLLVYNEAVLRDGSKTLAEADVVPKISSTREQGIKVGQDESDSAFVRDRPYNSSTTDVESSVSEGEAASPFPTEREMSKLLGGGDEDNDASASPSYVNTLLASGTGQVSAKLNKGILGQAAPNDIKSRKAAAGISTRSKANNNKSAEEKIQQDLAQSSAFVRITTLCFLERHPALASSVAFALVEFLDEEALKSGARVARKTKSKEQQERVLEPKNAKPLVPNHLSDYHREQLRAWQAVVVLINVVQPKYLASLVPRLMYHFGLPQLPDVRSYIEYALCILAEREQKRRDDNVKVRDDYRISLKFAGAPSDLGRVSEYFTNELVRILNEVGTGTPQVLASAILVAGYWAENTELLSKGLLLNSLLLPYLTSNVALVRGTAQLVYYRLHAAMAGASGHQFNISDVDSVETGEVLGGTTSAGDLFTMQNNGGPPARQENQGAAPALAGPRVSGIVDEHHQNNRHYTSQLLRMLTEHKDHVKMRKRLEQNLQHWNPKLQSQIALVFENKDAIYDYRPSYMFLSEIRSCIDQEMQSLWHKHTELDESMKVGPMGYIWVDEGEQLLSQLKDKVQEAAKVHQITSTSTTGTGSLPDVALQRKFNPFTGGGTTSGGTAAAGASTEHAARDQENGGNMNALNYSDDTGAATSMSQIEDLFFAQQLAGAKKKQTRSKLIVVASLIDKAPNLAGLARTCEIFNAEALVVGNKDIIKDPGFQSVSVTAEKWINLLEVKPENLKQFLQLHAELKEYRIIGVEQTHTSVCLSEFKFFPENKELRDKNRTKPSTGRSRDQQVAQVDEQQGVILLLGAEKEGLPAELIHMCDQCVEIPQRGIIRSLNVHVSAALIIWEYVRQEMQLLAEKRNN